MVIKLVIFLLIPVLFINCVFTAENFLFQDDGTSAGKKLEKLIGLENRAAKTCTANEFVGNDGNCHECFDHFAICNDSRQCCSPNMACWVVNYNPPNCRCNPNYAWNSTACVYSPIPSVFVISVYTALAAGCVITVFAILYYCFSYCKMQRNRRRQRNGMTRPQFRCRRRRPQQQQQPQQPNQQHGQVIDYENAPPLPNKPPNYEEVFGMPSVSEAYSRQMNTGSVRSLPPEYTPYMEGTMEPVTVITPTENSTAVSNTIESSTLSEGPQRTTSTGIVNMSYSPDDYHI